MSNIMVTFDDGSQALAHYGVLGMKWGVRRYQNSDGSLTNAGKKRYGDDENNITRRQMRKRVKDAKKAYRKEAGFFKSEGFTGKESHRVYKNFTKKLNSDPEYKKAQAKADKAHEILSQRKKELYSAMGKSNEYSTAFKENPSLLNLAVSAGAASQFYKAKGPAKEALENYNKAAAKADKAYSNIAKKYVNAYNNATVKELGFQNIAAGKKYLDAYSSRNSGKRVFEIDRDSTSDWDIESLYSNKRR